MTCRFLESQSEDGQTDPGLYEQKGRATTTQGRCFPERQFVRLQEAASLSCKRTRWNEFPRTGERLQLAPQVIVLSLPPWN